MFTNKHSAKRFCTVKKKKAKSNAKRILFLRLKTSCYIINI